MPSASIRPPSGGDDVAAGPARRYRSCPPASHGRGRSGSAAGCARSAHRPRRIHSPASERGCAAGCQAQGGAARRSAGPGRTFSASQSRVFGTTDTGQSLSSRSASIWFKADIQRRRPSLAFGLQPDRRTAAAARPPRPGPAGRCPAGTGPAATAGPARLRKSGRVPANRPSGSTITSEKLICARTLSGSRPGCSGRAVGIQQVAMPRGASAEGRCFRTDRSVKREPRGRPDHSAATARHGRSAMGRAPVPGARLPAAKASSRRAARSPRRRRPVRASSAPEIGASTTRPARPAAGPARQGRPRPCCRASRVSRAAPAALSVDKRQRRLRRVAPPSSSVRPSSAAISSARFSIVSRPSPTCQARPARSSVSVRVSPSASIVFSALQRGAGKQRRSTAVQDLGKVFRPRAAAAAESADRAGPSARAAPPAARPTSRTWDGRTLPDRSAAGSKATAPRAGSAATVRCLIDQADVLEPKARHEVAVDRQLDRRPATPPRPRAAARPARPAFSRASISATAQTGRRRVLPV